MEKILEKMMYNCTSHGFEPTENVEKIARAKKMMFGEEEWSRCPCDGHNDERFCLSDLCRSDIESNGICHCRCYKKK